MPGGSAGGDKPMENISFAYGKIKWEYTPIDQTGSPGATTDRTWNLETNRQD
jgi:type VI secretion system secreted protein Hcp